jgi:hypothetical protein
MAPYPSHDHPYHDPVKIVSNTAVESRRQEEQSKGEHEVAVSPDKSYTHSSMASHISSQQTV